MIQARHIKTVKATNNKIKKMDLPLNPDLKSESIFNLFKSLPAALKIYPDITNFYFTLGHADPTATGDGRTWISQDVISFDIDHCEYIDDILNEKYLPALEAALGLARTDFCVVATGYGLQCLIPLAIPITDKKYFKQNKSRYKLILDKIIETLQAQNLPGVGDVSAFEPNRLHRLPFTINSKPGRGDRKSYLVTAYPDKPAAWSLFTASGIPDVQDVSEVPIKAISRLAIDTPQVESCEFLKHSLKNQNSLSEPEWYAMITITSRLDATGEKTHEYSKDYKKYSPEEVEKKRLYALENSGPRTCENINSLWGNCKSCSHWGKVKSPISLKSEGFIATKGTGFWFLNKDGKPTTPDYDGLLKHYFNEHHFLNVKDFHYVYETTHYIEVDDYFPQMFVERVMDPAPMHVHRREFLNKVKLYSRQQTADALLASAAKKINFKNGVYCLDTNELLPHSPEYFFTHTLSYDYDPLALAPKFSKFLDEITLNRKELKNILLEFMGYAISGIDCRSAKFLVCTGTGANGKSTLMQILQALVGGISSKTFSSIPFRRLGEEFSNIRLFNKLFNIMDESEIYLEKAQFETLKDFSAGGLVTGANKFKDAIEFTNTAKFILLCNEIPKGGNPNKGLYRRMLIVPFGAEFEGKSADAFIVDKIVSDELPGIMNMLLEAYWNLKARDFRFEETQDLIETLEDYKQEHDSVARWATCNLIFAPAADGDLHPAPIYPLRELRNHYENWLAGDGEKPVAINQFTKRLIAHCKNKKYPIKFHKLRRIKGVMMPAIEGIALMQGDD